jgi:hypothetical protein
MRQMAGLTVIGCRGAVASFEELPSRSIALDGVVQGPMLDPSLERYSFDHHGSCVRLATSATCLQVLDALLLGLDPEGFSVFVNDVDSDVVMSMALLMDTSRIRDPWVLRLVRAVASRDAHGPAYPGRDGALTAAMGRAIRAATAVLTPAALLDELAAALDAVSRFIDERQEPETLDLESFDVGQHVTHRGNGWVMIRSDRSVFDAAYRAGFRRVIAYQPDSNDSWSYTVARQSDFVDGFPVGAPLEQPSIITALSDHEPGWGGGSTVGGAPKHSDGSRSRLTPNEVFEIVEAFLEQQRAGHIQGSKYFPTDAIDEAFRRDYGDLNNVQVEKCP